MKTRENAVIPDKRHENDACYDLYAALHETLRPGESRIIWFGIAIELPEGTKGVIYGRSGLTSRGILCCPTIVDSNYRGEIGATMTNTTNMPYTVKPGDRTAQLCVEPAPSIVFSEVEELTESERGGNGFGSTGR